MDIKTVLDKYIEGVNSKENSGSASVATKTHQAKELPEYVTSKNRSFIELDPFPLGIFSKASTIFIMNGCSPFVCFWPGCKDFCNNIQKC